MENKFASQGTGTTANESPVRACVFNRVATQADVNSKHQGL